MTTTTAERTYIFNRETLKIELHFEKAEYDALNEEQRRELKSNFLWSRQASAWVSRAKEPNLYRARQVANKLGFTQEQRQGERLSFAQQVERSVERAEARADRYEGYADNAEKRGESLQAELNSFRGDIAFFTQPNINSSAGRAFKRQRERMFERYQKGFEEYKKSKYFMSRAEIAQNTADMRKFKDPIYLNNRIKECKKNIKAMEKNLIRYEEILHALETGTDDKYISREKLSNYTIREVTEWIEETLERIEAEIDKQGYMENCLDEIGGNRFSKDNIKPGYIVKLARWGNVEVTGTGPVNFTYKHDLTPNHKDWPGQEAYAAILEIVEAKEPERPAKIVNPYKEGDILCKHRPADNSIYRAFQVVKATAAGVKIQRIEVENGKPIPGKFISDKVMQKKIVKSKYSDWVGVYDDDWQLHKYNMAQ